MAATPPSPSEALYAVTHSERMTYRLSLFMGVVLVPATWFVHHALDPDAFDPMSLRLVIAAALFAGTLATFSRRDRVVRHGTLGSLCALNGYAGWLASINGLVGPWAQTGMTACVSSLLIQGTFAPHARSAVTRTAWLVVSSAGATALFAEDMGAAVAAAVHLVIISLFLLIVVVIHLRTRESLRHARDRALDATRAKAQFLANMSHEIRTPMNGVIGTAAMLDDGTLRQDQAELVSTLNSSGESLLAIINDILDFSKIEAGALSLEEEPFDLRQGLEEAAQLLRPAARTRGLELVTEIDAAMPPGALGDGFRVRQVVTNLLSNAIKFTEQGSITLRASRKDGRFVIAVEDTGVGIAPARLERIFESFRQADESTTRRFGGTGLGLTISRELVERMGGTIAVSSGLGAGSTFEMQLPLEVAEVPDAQGIQSPSQAEMGVTFEALKVLLVDDNAVNRRVASRMLQRLGIEPDLAEDGLQALEAARGTSYDVIFMDVQMPKLDGLSATRRIRASQDAGDPWIVALTAGATAEDRRNSAEAGANDHVTKPVRPLELKASLERSVEARQGQRGAA